ncbi:MAG: hypothetical protein HQ553_16730 [Chloroflexi bacterium]|nr:hypothetical protein [Chloroflexota bacterium]
MIKRSWKNVLGITVLALTISGLAIVPVAMADEGDESSSTPQPGERCEVFKGKMADNLGVTTGDLDAGITDAMTEMIDEAVAAGKMNPERAEEMKQRIAENSGMCGWMKNRFHHGPQMMGTGMLDRAVEEEIITQEQADEIVSVKEDVRAYCEENGCARDGGIFLEKAVENDVITQEQADEIKAILEQVKDQIGENGGFRGHRCGDGEGSIDMENGSFPQREFRGGHGMMGMGEAA